MGEERRERWDKRNAYILIGKPEDKKHLEDQGVEGRMILKCFLNKWGVG
jgi:hypothetical protein